MCKNIELKLFFSIKNQPECFKRLPTPHPNPIPHTSCHNVEKKKKKKLMRWNDRTISRVIPQSRRQINPRSLVISCAPFNWIIVLIRKKTIICRTVDSNKRLLTIWIVILSKLVNDPHVTTAFVWFLHLHERTRVACSPAYTTF